MRITAIRLDRMRLPLDPPFYAAWDPVPRRHFDATLVTVHTDEGVTGYGSGDTMDGFDQADDPPGWTEARRDFFLAEPIRVDADGYLTVPDAPGLGAEINHPAVARYTRTD